MFFGPQNITYRVSQKKSAAVFPSLLIEYPSSPMSESRDIMFWNITFDGVSITILTSQSSSGAELLPRRHFHSEIMKIFCIDIKIYSRGGQKNQNLDFELAVHIFPLN